VLIARKRSRSVERESHLTRRRVLGAPRILSEPSSRRIDALGRARGNGQAELPGVQENKLASPRLIFLVSRRRHAIHSLWPAAAA
jgi:hypothetical protein